MRLSGSRPKTRCYPVGLIWNIVKLFAADRDQDRERPRRKRRPQLDRIPALANLCRICRALGVPVPVVLRLAGG